MMQITEDGSSQVKQRITRTHLHRTFYIRQKTNSVGIIIAQSQQNTFKHNQ
jgi:hypothetical protein